MWPLCPRATWRLCWVPIWLLCLASRWLLFLAFMWLLCLPAERLPCLASKVWLPCLASRRLLCLLSMWLLYLNGFSISSVYVWRLSGFHAWRLSGFHVAFVSVCYVWLLNTSQCLCSLPSTWSLQRAFNCVIADASRPRSGLVVSTCGFRWLLCLLLLIWCGFWFWARGHRQRLRPKQRSRSWRCLGCQCLGQLGTQGSARITVEGDLDPAVAEFATQGPLQLVLPKSYQGGRRADHGIQRQKQEPHTH